MRLLDFVSDRRHNTLSASKLWFNIGNAALVMAFVKDAWLGNLTDMKIFAFGAIVCGSGIASKWIAKKYAGPVA